MADGPQVPANANAAALLVRRVLIHNEQVKLRATILNTVAAGLVVAGIITPIATALIAGTSFSGSTVVLMLIWFVGAIILHSGASLVLETLR